MKKPVKSKSIIAVSLALLCVALLAVCFLWGRDDTPEFVPDPTPSGSPTEDWSENPSSDMPEGNGGTIPGGNPADEPEEAYPKTVSDGGENEGETVIDFTDPDPDKEPPPAEPGTDKDHVDHDAVPEQTPSNDGAPQENPQPDTPAPGSTNAQGQVYDPAFGWIKPAEVIQEPIDSEGDLDKMVGEMD